MRAVFLDASYVIALEWTNDQSHSAAVDHWPSVEKSGKRLVTTSFVVDEVVTFFATRGLHEKAVEAGEWLVSSSSIDVVWVDEAIFHDGFEYLRRRGDKQYSLADCISFVVMESLEGDALAFDAHFERAGFRRLPGR